VSLDPIASSEGPSTEETTKQIRGSTLLTGGRAISLAINFAVQVLIVRHLSQAGYGAFAYALSLVAVGEAVVTFGLDRAITRFVPMYEERGDYGRMLGTLIMVVGFVLAVGLALVFLVIGLQGWLAGSVIKDPMLVSVIVILVALAPIQAYDGILIGMFAVLANARAIFFRKHILGPGLRLLVVGLLVTVGGGVQLLAAGYVAAGALGVALYSFMLWRVLQRRGLLRHFDRTTLSFPVREVLTFTVPLLSSDLVYVVLNASDAVLLEHFRGADAVAALRVVQPAAMMNQLVFTSFALLFTPLASRLFARGDRQGVNELYWRTAAWMAVFSFPIFALTFANAGPLTVALYEPRYASSGTYLALFALGYYFNVALGFNGLTLKVYGRLRYIVLLNLAAAVVNVGINLLLIPRYGALGAAIGTTLTLVVHNLLKQAGLALGTGVNILDPRYVRVYLVILAAVMTLVAMTTLFKLSLAMDVALTVAASLAVLLLNRDALRVSDTFPVLLRLPFGRQIFGT
jgi:O-antigen/teichoic acid export membrane protein